LLALAKQIMEEWMKNQPGFMNWEIHSTNDGGYTDIVYWKSKQDAMNAEKEMGNISNAGDWFACYKEGTTVSKNLTTISDF
jgi:hypothetical protein